MWKTWHSMSSSFRDIRLVALLIGWPTYSSTFSSSKSNEQLTLYRYEMWQTFILGKPIAYIKKSTNASFVFCTVSCEKKSANIVNLNVAKCYEPPFRLLTWFSEMQKFLAIFRTLIIFLWGSTFYTSNTHIYSYMKFNNQLYWKYSYTIK